MLDLFLLLLILHDQSMLLSYFVVFLLNWVKMKLWLLLMKL